MKPANASAMRSTSDPLSVHRHIRSPDELTLPLRPSQSRMSWRPSDSACDPDVKRPGRAVVVSHTVAATISIKFGWEHSGQRDFVKLNRVHFENRGYASPEPGNTPVHGASGQNCGTTVSKLDAV